MKVVKSKVESPPFNGVGQLLRDITILDCKLADGLKVRRVDYETNIALHLVICLSVYRRKSDFRVLVGIPGDC